MSHCIHTLDPLVLRSDTIYVRSRDSYPLGRTRTPLARPDLIHMLNLDGRLFSLKVLVLLRNLSDCIRSAHRMGWDTGDAGLQVCGCDMMSHHVSGNAHSI